MSREFAKVAIVARHDDARVAEPMRVLIEYLTKSGIRVFAAAEMQLPPPVQSVAESELASRAQLMIAIGGDGTMLYAGNLARQSEIPLLGINRGRLGFLADVTPDAMLESLDHILSGEYSRESRSLLSATLKKADGRSLTATAVNDVVVQRRGTGRTIDVVANISGRYVNTHSGDGLIVATPTGSTAYALSCGGPIIEPQLDAIVMVPICPHTLTDRPIVISAEQTIEIRLVQRENSNAEVTIDGHPIGAIRADDTLNVAAASERLILIHPPGYDLYGILRSKLYWGRDGRNRNETPG